MEDPNSLALYCCENYALLKGNEELGLESLVYGSLTVRYDLIDTGDGFLACSVGPLTFTTCRHEHYMSLLCSAESIDFEGRVFQVRCQFESDDITVRK